MKLSIFSFKDLNKPGGTPIRTIGHSSYLKEFGYTVDFYSPFKPNDELLKKVNYKKIKIPPLLQILLRAYITFPALRFILKQIILLKFPLVKQLMKIDNPMIFNQNYNLGFFLYKGCNKVCIYDVHGIIDYQREYLAKANNLDKIVFFMDLIKERFIFKHGKYFIFPSKELMLDIAKRFNLDKKFLFVGKDALLYNNQNNIDLKLINEIKKKYRISENDKVVLFIGNFKKFGGVLDLFYAYLNLIEEFPKLKLLLIGSGQDEKIIQEQIDNLKLNDKIIHIKSIPYDQINYFQQLSQIIICPDKKNHYSSLNPHIKIFDSIASGKPLIFSYFLCLKTLMKELQGFEVFEPSNIIDLEKKMRVMINGYAKYEKLAKENLQLVDKFTYKKASEGLMKQFKKRLAE